MVFKPPPWIPPSSFDESSIPDSIPIPEFIFSDKYNKNSQYKNNNQDDYHPFICAHTSTSYSFPEVRKRVSFLSRALASNLNWHPNKGSEWDKVVAVFSVNTIDTLPLYWTVHRLSGVVTPVNAEYGVEELVYQLKASRARVLVTCRDLLGVAIRAVKKLADANSGILDEDRIYLLDSAVSPSAAGGGSRDYDYSRFKTVNGLIDEGSRLPPLEELAWEKAQGTRQCAFLCYSSGTSGLPVCCSPSVIFL
jgi:acyl-CoA synthetase (AMP-forming)/AMP-acid ligase II